MNFFFAWGKFDSLYIKYNDACVQLRLLRFIRIGLCDRRRKRGILREEKEREQERERER